MVTWGSQNPHMDDKPKNGDTPVKLVALLHGISENDINDIGVFPIEETPKWMYPILI